jgi:hypothetical protein
VQITLSEALGWLKTLRERHTELLNLRNENSFRERIYRGANADKTTEKIPVYDVKALDKTIGRVAREIRLLDMAIKRTNAATVVVGYDQDDAVLGELEGGEAK